ncbi:hypothetical protein KCP71_08520 [Salmonella enterica subsp. enterica]|nr:hypothetical protein KCP71_08520 [Salmonella enterica subsp. enterica]
MNIVVAEDLLSGVAEGDEPGFIAAGNATLAHLMDLLEDPILTRPATSALFPGTRVVESAGPNCLMARR